MNGEFDVEPIPGLPEELPAGETLLWQGSPRWQVLAVRLFRVHLVALYFAVTGGFAIAAAVSDGAFGSLSWLVLLGAPVASIGLLALIAWLIARSTVYTLTSRRVVMRFGVALPMTVNVAFACVDSAAVKRHADGSGDISLGLTPDSKVAYAVMWPHVRPWRLGRAEPTLRGLPNIDPVAEKVASALAAIRAAAPAAQEQAPVEQSTATASPVGASLAGA